MENGYAIVAEGVSKKYKLYRNKKDRLVEALNPWKSGLHRDFFALRDIDLKVRKGEILGIVGKNGSGKSTLLKIISGILTPTSGKLTRKGSIIALLELGSGFNPEFTGIENIYFYCSVLGYNKNEIKDKVQEIIEFAEIGEHIDQPLKTYSSGMRARLAFAVSIFINPEILIIDEILSVGDELFRRKSFMKMEESFRSGRTILFVSHNMNAVNRLCTRAILLDEGEQLLEGPPAFITKHYEKLLFASPSNKPAIREELRALNNDPVLKLNFMDGYDEVEEPGQHSLTSVDLREEEEKEGLADHFIPDFKPKSTVITRNAEIDITDMSIRNQHGKEVNLLTTGKTYVFSFLVRFGLDAEDISFQAFVNNSKGIRLSGSSLHMDALNPVSPVRKGDILRVEFSFTCNLLKDVYFIGLNINQLTKNNIITLCRIQDAFVFKARPAEALSETGIVFMHQKMNIQRENT
jgi:lipopolysaccharide transport system ATP-binding protein